MSSTGRHLLQGGNAKSASAGGDGVTQEDVEVSAA
ncbi:hypothetical protein A2U01_0105453, partial [Trifolium medium]|nr:hypothetical protein [Trifolium medium]